MSRSISLGPFTQGPWVAIFAVADRQPGQMCWALQPSSTERVGLFHDRYLVFEKITGRQESVTQCFGSKHDNSEIFIMARRIDRE